jgi:thiamine pyrophosphokinase
VRTACPAAAFAPAFNEESLDLYGFGKNNSWEVTWRVCLPVKFLIMTNGAYDDLNWYRKQRTDCFDWIICVDGGAGWAGALSLTPHWIVGDLDSICEEDRRYMEIAGVPFKTFPCEKNHTDTQLALGLAAGEGAKKVVVWGGTGSRLDHTISNICSAAALLTRGIDVLFDSPGVTVYLVKDQLVLPGSVGDTVSLIVLGDRAAGVNLHGFQYPLRDAVLESRWQWAVSNVITEPGPVVKVASGNLAVFHYKTPIT